MVISTKYYDLLGVAPDAEAAAIRKAYRKRALLLHPDKNSGNPEPFKELNHAFCILDDPHKRRQYDQFGESGVQNADSLTTKEEADYATRMFERFFGGSDVFEGMPPPPPDVKRGRDVQHPHRVSLEDLYCGKISKLALQKSIICSGCQGFGGTQGPARVCVPCGGRGVIIRQFEVAPGFTQGMSQKCEDCDGEGEIIDDADRCRVCMGRKTLTERKVLQLTIEKGMRHGQKIIFRSEGDQQPGVTPGDVVIVIDEKPHPRFQRDQHDLIMDMEIELVEALCGFTRAITHLDNRVITVTCKRGEVTRDGDIKCVYGEGMPHFKNPDEKGRLLIKFRVRFPHDNFTSLQNLALLESMLPPRPPVPVEAESAEDYDLHPLDFREKAHLDSRGTEENGGPTQCRSQ